MAKKSKSFGRRFFRFIFKMIVWGVIISLFYVLFCKWINPPFTITQLSSVIQGEDVHRNYIDYNQMGSNIKLAVMASEDQDFPFHHGFDLNQIQKAVNASQDGKRLRGASTISQQTAKNVFLWQHGGWIRKGLEVYFTFLIETFWSKRRILEVYLNVIEMGPGIFGIGSAAQIYFKRSPDELTRDQAAKVAACLPNPKKFTVVPLSKRVRIRYPQIVRQMNNLDGNPGIVKLIRD